MNRVLFDSSLHACVSSLLKYVSAEILGKSAVLRDITGQLGVVLACNLSQETKEQISSELIFSLGDYARPYGLVTDLSDFDSESLLLEATLHLPIIIEGVLLRVLDRRAVGADWLADPVIRHAGALPCFVFASIKGGVGRSTALCVAAAHLSQRGRRVLAIDFDLEAPGIGSMLLHEKELPSFGSLDFLVESQISGFDEELIQHLIGSSYLGAAGARVDVIPAIGKTTLQYPQNALAKIARAYLEMLPEGEGVPVSLGGKLRKLVELCEATGRYDAILIDSRAGLHESTAAAMLALGGNLLLFGTDQPQTFQGYSLLLGHFAQFPVESQKRLLDRLNFVHAKAGRTDKARQEVEKKFKDLYHILAAPLTGIDSDSEQPLDKDDIDIVWDESPQDVTHLDIPEEAMECKVLHIKDDGMFRDFDPIAKGDLLDPSIYENTFEDLIQYLDEEISDIGEVE